MDKGVVALKMLLDGSSIRAIERIVGINRNTILRLLELVGERCYYYWVTCMKSLPAENVQCDEVWGFVYAKAKTCQRKDLKGDVGDAYCFLGIQRDTKLVLAWHVGRRQPEDTAWFTDKLRQGTSGRFQVSTDGFKPYCTALPESFHGNIDFAQLVKIYGKQQKGTEGRYSPLEITGIRKREMWGKPEMDAVCTRHVERQNLNIRMGGRRMTRLTNAFNKKRENHEYHLAFYLLWYNYCRAHMTLKTTPAVKAKLTDHIWTLEELLETLATHY